MRRRVGFAAPLVMVVACGQAPPGAIPVEAPAGMEPAVAVVEPVDAMPADAPPEPKPVDAAPAPAVDPVGYVVLILPDRLVQPPGAVSCHDFGPGSRGCNPPRPVRHPAERRQVPIVQLARSADGYLVSLELGDEGLVDRRAGVQVRPPLRRGKAPSARLRELQGEVARIELAMSRDEIINGLELEVGDRTDAPWKPMPPPPLDGKITDAQADGTATTIITFDLGTRDGVRVGMKGAVVDRRGKEVRGSRFTVARAGAHAAIAKVKLTPDQVRAAGHVRIEDAPP